MDIRDSLVFQLCRTIAVLMTKRVIDGDIQKRRRVVHHDRQGVGVKQLAIAFLAGDERCRGAPALRNVLDDAANFCRAAISLPNAFGDRMDPTKFAVESDGSVFNVDRGSSRLNGRIRGCDLFSVVGMHPFEKGVERGV